MKRLRRSSLGGFFTYSLVYKFHNFIDSAWQLIRVQTGHPQQSLARVEKQLMTQEIYEETPLGNKHSMSGAVLKTKFSHVNLLILYFLQTSARLKSNGIGKFACA